MRNKATLLGTIVIEGKYDTYKIQEVDGKFSLTSDKGYGRYDITSLTEALKKAKNRIVIDNLDNAK